MKLKTSVSAFVLAAVLPLSAAMAGPAADDLGACMVHSVDHHDRVVMDRFFLAALSEKPDLKPLVKMSGDQRNKADHDMRVLMTRLIRHDCRPEAIRAAHAEGPAAARNAVLALTGAIGDDLAHAPQAQRELNGLSHGAVADALDDVSHDAPPPPGPHGPDAPPPPPFP